MHACVRPCLQQTADSLCAVTTLTPKNQAISLILSSTKLIKDMTQPGFAAWLLELRELKASKATRFVQM
jgi:hypothetical protein